MDTNNLIARYRSLKDIVISEDTERAMQFSELMDHIEQNTEFLIAPASTKFHMCCECGLLYHTVSVAEIMIRLKKVLAPEISNASCIIVALLHDVGKHNQYVEREATPRQKEYGYKAFPPYEVDCSITYMDHEIRSLHMISQFNFKLTEDEWQAIAYHNEPYTSTRSAFKESKLTVLLQTADYWSTRFNEKSGKDCEEKPER